jgi:hypothetical protein
MNPTTPTEVQVITEVDVYEASVRKVVSRGNLNASPLTEASYSWSDVEAEEAKKPNVQEQTNLQKSAFTESVNEQLDKLMTEIEDIANKENNIKVDVELESDEDMPELVDSESDMPDLVSDDEMPDLVEESDDEMPDLVEETESESDSENEELMIAVFKRPSCPRCEAALKVLMAHDENGEEAEESEEEHTSDVEEAEDESDDSDSDYVPSDSESESPRTVRQLRRWNMSEPVENKRTPCVPPLIQFIAIVLFVIHVLKFLLNEPSQRIRCYS